LRSVVIENRQYSRLMMVLHWVMALGILIAFGVGLYMVDIPGISPQKLRLFNWHKWMGVTLFILVGLRLIVKSMSHTPPYPEHWGSRSIRLVKLGHGTLYFLMFFVPLMGYFYSLAAGYPVVWFGVIKLPVLIDKNPELKEIFETLHELSAKLLVLIVLGHIVMAIKHHFINHEAMLGRMIPGFPSKTKNR
jgi:cytochrome b561